MLQSINIFLCYRYNVLDFPDNSRICIFRKIIQYALFVIFYTWCNMSTSLIFINKFIFKIGNFDRYNKVYEDRCLSTGLLAVALDDVLREETGLPAIDGMYIASVEPKSAAAAAHVRAEDILLQVGEEQVYDKETFAKAFLAQEGQKKVKIKVWRGGGILTLDLPLTF